MAEECATSKQNLDKSRCVKLPGLPAWMFTVPDSFELTDVQIATQSALKTALQTALKASTDARIYKWPRFSNGEDASEETIYSESAFGSRKIRDGNYRFKFMISKSLCLHKKMFSHSSNEGRVIVGDKEGRIWLTLKSNGKYTGLSVDMLNVEKMKINFGDVLTETPIYVSLADNKELDEAGELVPCSIYNELEALTDVDLAVSDVSASDFKVTVTQTCDGTPVSGLVKADFVGTSIGTIDTVTEPNSDGVYLITADTVFVDGSINLVAASLLSLDAYESTGAVEVNVP